MTQKVCSRRRLDDLASGANIAMIRRDRGTRGGGVAICYNPNKLKLTRFPVPNNQNKVEVVCATGSVGLTKRRLALISVYMPPNIKGTELDLYVYTLVELIDAIKTKHEDAAIFWEEILTKRTLAGCLMCSLNLGL